MDIERSRGGHKLKRILSIRRLYGLLAPRAYSVLMLGALFCTVAVKFYHSCRVNMVGDYITWILDDVAILLALEALVVLVCFRWPRRRVIYTSTIFAAVVCTWSIINASWVIRKGMQILPRELLPLFRDPLNSFGMVGVNLAKMPIAAVLLLGPSAIGLGFFIFVLAKPALPNYDRKRLIRRMFFCFGLIVVSVLASTVIDGGGSVQVVSARMRYNSHLRAVTSFFLPGYGRGGEINSSNASREIPTFDGIDIKPPKSKGFNHNVIIIVLEGVQYRHTSFADRNGDLTPHLVALARRGVEFSNARSAITHTTKTLFSLLTGRFASASEDLAEAVPVEKPYASLATVLGGHLNYRTAFFQSAKGNFEARPGLVHNLGFEKFWARDDLNDPNAFVGYLGSDEFSMLKPITEWIRADESPFFLTVLCSVTHDPYVVPEWFATPAKEPVQRYRQTIQYTDEFIAALDVELAKLGLAEETIVCVVGDHGEAFGEHGLYGHERIAFDEALKIPFCLRAPFLVAPGIRVTEAVSSVDLTPTLLTMLGFDISGAGFDGLNVLGSVPDERKVYFAGWMRQGTTGFIRENRKFIYSPTNKMVTVYDLNTDPFELVRGELSEEQVQEISDDVIAWQKSTIFRINQQRSGKKVLFESWLCRWTDRVSSAKYLEKNGK